MKSVFKTTWQTSLIELSVETVTLDPDETVSLTDISINVYITEEPYVIHNL